MSPTNPVTRHSRQNSGAYLTSRLQAVSNTVIIGQWETVTSLSALLFLIMIIPARLVVGPLGAAGRPAGLVAVAFLIWWLNITFVRGGGPTLPSYRNPPARRIITFFALCVLISYVMAATRPIEGVEMRSADRGLISLCAWAGVWLMTSETLGDHDRIERLLRRMAIFGAVMAVVGMAQYFLSIDPSQWVVIPGLHPNTEAQELTRNGLNRPAATTGHPLEFGVLMAALIPVAAHQLIHAGVDEKRWAKIRFGLIVIGAALSVSRSAILGLVVGGLIMLPSVPREWRRRLLKSSPFFLIALHFVAPGLLGTIYGLFAGISTDDSAASRTGSYTIAWQFIRQAPVFGRGMATFLPSYRILDNQLLGSTIELGVVGLTALLILLITGPVCAYRAARRTPDPRRRSLGVCIAASAAVLASSFATFDVLGFGVVSASTFFMGGLCWAFVALQRRSEKSARAAGSDTRGTEFITSADG